MQNKNTGMASYGSVINFYPFILLLALTYVHLCLSSSSSTSNTHLCHLNQRDALLRFKNTYNIANAFKVRGVDTTIWEEYVDCCQWIGIFCDHITGDVIGIVMENPRIKGTIDNIAEILSPINSLRRLDLVNNNLHGVIPAELAYFSKLNKLTLHSYQNLTMESHSLKLLAQNLTQLQELYLSRVKISGDSSSALVNISSALTTLHLYDCDMQGTFPESVFHLPHLHTLRMHENTGLKVTLPTFNQSSSLIRLGLLSINFSGKLPDSIGNLKNLESLAISLCHISGSVPSSIGNLTQLAQLSLSSFVNIDAFPFSICRLSSLQELYLPGNNFSGMIPRCLGNLTTLRALDLSSNHFIGLLPPSLANYTLLEHLNVSANMINDSVTHWLEFFPDLITIDLRENSFYGEIPLFICRSTPTVIDLSYNRLTGTIPPCLINSTRYGIKILNLRRNNLEGIIPDKFQKYCPTAELDLSENRLKGPLPQSMANCEELIILGLSNNNIEDFFPTWLETLRELQILVLKSNKFHGEVKTLLKHPFPNLRIFDISNNNLVGLLPIEYISQLNAMKGMHASESSLYLEIVDFLGREFSYSMPTTMKGLTHTLPKILNDLELIDFSNNNFCGEIPEIIGDLISLKGLNLSHNNLTGNIPPSIQKMNSLEWLDLSSNKLTGQIPGGLTQLTSLEVLNLSDNELRGMIPKGNQFDTFGKDSFAGNAGLCGSQIAIACGKPDTPLLPPLPSIQEDDFDAFDWKVILIGYGCGLIIGLSIGYVVFELRTPKWFVLLVEEKLLKKIMKARRRATRLHRT